MKAAVFHGKHHISIEPQELSPLQPEEVRIQVAACGICGTDQHIYHGQPGSAAVQPPLVLGHELSGVVVEIGSAVKSLKQGDRVSVDPNMYCGNCVYCRSGAVQLCDHLQAVGVTRGGGMGQYCNVPASNCYQLPDELSDVEGALVEPLGCVLHGCKKLDIRPIHSVLIIGGGFIGQLFLQLMCSRAVKEVAVCEPVEAKRQSLLRLGASEVFSPQNEEEKASWYDRADIVVECVGRKDSMEFAVQAASKGGQVLLFGVAAPSAEISVSPYLLFTKELKLMGSFINPHTHEEAIALIRRKVVEVEGLVSHRFELDQVPAVMASYEGMNVAKGVIVY